jgi:hypothetical protein
MIDSGAVSVLPAVAHPPAPPVGPSLAPPAPPVAAALPTSFALCVAFVTSLKVRLELVPPPLPPILPALAPPAPPIAACDSVSVPPFVMPLTGFS